MTQIHLPFTAMQILLKYKEIHYSKINLALHKDVRLSSCLRNVLYNLRERIPLSSSDMVFGQLFNNNMKCC